MNIYLDPFRLMPPNGALEVADELTYVEARTRILAYLLGRLKIAPTFIIHEHPYTAWFEDVPNWLVKVSPRSKLIEKYPNAVLPVNLTDADILALKLLTAEVEPTDSGLRKHYFGTLLEKVVVNPETLLKLATFVTQEAGVFKKRFLKQVWQERLSGLPEPLSPLREADKAFCQALAEGIYMAGIPALITDWEHSNAVQFKTNYGISLTELLPLIRWTNRTFPDIPELESLLAKRLHQLLKEGGKELNNIMLPGIYRAELEALLANTPKLTIEQRQNIEKRYVDLITPELYQRLQRLVPPTLDPVPTLSGLSLDEKAEAWKQWAVSSYIPYKFWLDNLPAPDPAQIDLVESLATQYGDWLFDNSSALLANDNVLTNYDVHKQVLGTLQTSNYSVIWLIIDGFPAAFVSLLEQLLRAHGLIRQTKYYAFATLPTITEVGIPALLNGLTADSSAYTTDRRIALKQAFPDHTTAFAAVAGKFQDVLDSNADVCCLHWQEIDKMLHRDDSEFDTPTARLDKISELLNERLGKLAMVINRRTDRPTKLIISTDHGATKCLRNSLNIKNAKITEAAAAHPYERSVKLEGKLLSVHLDATETYHLTTDVTRNPITYVAARGYRYFGANDRGYRHGGLTPEETIVPILVADMVEFIVEPLLLTYYGSDNGLEQGKTLKGFTIQIRNRNTFVVEVLSLVIKEDHNCQFTLPVRIGPDSVVTLSTTIKIAQKYKAQNGQLPLTATVTYRANAEEFTEKNTFFVPIKSNEIDDFDFDGL